MYRTHTGHLEENEPFPLGGGCGLPIPRHISNDAGARRMSRGSPHGISNAHALHPSEARVKNRILLAVEQVSRVCP